MPETPRSFATPWNETTRPELPTVGSERELLTAYLDWHRSTFALKCSGLLPEDLSNRSAPPSELSLHGLVRHLAATERWWFRINFAGEDVPLLYYSNHDPNKDFSELGDDPQQAFDTWRNECEQSRAIAAAASLDQVQTSASGKPLSLRRVLIDMTAEYARHNGHADLLRERIDGATGF